MPFCQRRASNPQGMPMFSPSWAHSAKGSASFFLCLGRFFHLVRSLLKCFVIFCLLGSVLFRPAPIPRRNDQNRRSRLSHNRTWPCAARMPGYRSVLRAAAVPGPGKGRFVGKSPRCTRAASSAHRFVFSGLAVLGFNFSDPSTQESLTQIEMANWGCAQFFPSGSGDSFIFLVISRQCQIDQLLVAASSLGKWASVFLSTLPHCNVQTSKKIAVWSCMIPFGFRWIKKTGDAFFFPDSAASIERLRGIFFPKGPWLKFLQPAPLPLISAVLGAVRFFLSSVPLVFFALSPITRMESELSNSDAECSLDLTVPG